MRILGVDLAARYSAAVGLVKTDTAEYCVMGQMDSLTDNDWFINGVINSTSGPFDYIVIEDLPQGLRFMKNVKQVCRLQGKIQGVAKQKGYSSEKIRFAPPSAWQTHFDGVWKGGLDGAREAARLCGYRAPNLHQDLRGKPRTQAIKVESDYVDAYLIARWALDVGEAKLLDKTNI